MYQEPAWDGLLIFSIGVENRLEKEPPMTEQTNNFDIKERVAPEAISLSFALFFCLLKTPRESSGKWKTKVVDFHFYLLKQIYITFF